MLRPNYSSNPYNTIKPRFFFENKKIKIEEEILKGWGGRSIQKPQKDADNLEKEAPQSISATFSSISHAPWSVYGSLISICICMMTF